MTSSSPEATEPSSSPIIGATSSLAGEQVDEPEADHGLRAAQQGGGRDLALFAGGDAEDDHAAERREDAELGVEGVAAAHVEDRVDPLAVVGLADRGAEVLAARVDRGVGAEALDQRRASPRWRRGR